MKAKARNCTCGHDEMSHYKMKEMPCSQCECNALTYKIPGTKFHALYEQLKDIGFGEALKEAASEG